MTTNIKQNITPRRSFSANSSWRNGQDRGFSFTKSTNKFTSQRGNINSTTLALVFSIIIVLFVATLGFFYLGQVMGTASQGTDVQVLEEKMVELKGEQRELELESARLRSIQSVENKVNHLDLVGTDKVAYLKGTANHQAFASAD